MARTCNSCANAWNRHTSKWEPRPLKNDLLKNPQQSLWQHYSPQVNSHRRTIKKGFIPCHAKKGLVPLASLCWRLEGLKFDHLLDMEKSSQRRPVRYEKDHYKKFLNSPRVYSTGYCRHAAKYSRVLMTTWLFVKAKQVAAWSDYTCPHRHV